ncbi:MAG: phosphatase PAP2 family protein [Thermomicrobiales bacterium]
MDYRLFHAINSLAGRFDGIDDCFEIVANGIPFVMIGMLLVLWFRPGERDERDRREWGCIAAVISATLALAINQLVSLGWSRPRPFVAHDAVLLISHHADGSFPSDHTTFAFAVGTSILLVSRRLGMLALLAAGAMAFARVYVGVHYVSDVVAGALIGTLSAIFVQQARPFIQP